MWLTSQSAADLGGRDQIDEMRRTNGNVTADVAGQDESMTGTNFRR
jgi:hypothetical protein